MFEDLLGSNRPKNQPSREFTNGGSADQVCPACGSTDIENVGGGFGNSTMYFSTMFCPDCKCKWTIEYDANLNIISVEIED